MIRFWDSKLSGAPPLLNWAVMCLSEAEGEVAKWKKIECPEVAAVFETYPI